MTTSISSLIGNRQVAYLSGRQVSQCQPFDFTALTPLIEKVYRTHYEGHFKLPVLDYLKYDGRSSYDRIIALLGYLGGEFATSGLKLIGSSTSNHLQQFPRASGLIVLNDPQTQRPFSILEANQISAARTAAVTALAIQRLAPETIHHVGFIGCGYLARVHLQMWAQLFRSKTEKLLLFDLRESAASEFAGWARDEFGLEVKACSCAREVVENAQVLIPMTTNEKPYIKASWVGRGTLYSAVSLLDPELEVLKQADYILVDDERLCKHEGRPLQLLEKEGFFRGRPLRTMGEVITRNLDLRPRSHERTFFNPMGTVLTDIATALSVLERSFRNGQFTILDL